MYQTILLPIDVNAAESQKKACQTAVMMAEACSGKIHVLCVVPDFGMSIVGSYFPEGFENSMLSKAAEQLDKFVAEHLPAELIAGKTVGHGSIYQVILESAEDCRANLIVMASHRPELQDYLLGPNAARVTRHAKCSVMVVRD